MTVSERQIPYVLPLDAVLGLEIYHDARRQRRLLVPRCTACGEYHWYPRSFCPFCHGHDLEWPQASGAGTIYSFSIMRRAEVPYVVAFVTLAEGPGMMTNIVGCNPGAVKIGLPVCLAFSTSAEGEPFPVFTLA